MRHRTGIFRELRLPQHAYIVDALDGATALGADHVGREFLIAEHRQAFLERQLEPVAARDAIAGPVVEIFMADHGFDIGVINVGRDAWDVGQTRTW